MTVRTCQPCLLATASAGLLAFATACSHGAALTSATATDEDSIEVSAPRLPAAGPEERPAPKTDAIRNLAAELDTSARRAARAASMPAGRRGHSEKELAEQTRRFSDAAGELHDRLETKNVDAGDLKSRVLKLNKIARRVDQRLAESHAPDSAFEAWERVSSLLDRVNLAALGRRAREKIAIPSHAFEDNGV
jgi:hypothetical protein